MKTHSFSGIIVRLFTFALVSATMLSTLQSCKKNPVPDPEDPTDSEQVQVNKWTYQILGTYYLWNQEIKNITPEYDTDYQSFLTSTLSKISVNTLDGHTYSDGSRTFYSYISRTAVSRAAAVSFDPTYGMRIAAYGFNIRSASGETTLRYFARIYYVTPDSPADKAGLKRGDWIGRIDDKIISRSNFSDLNKLLADNSVSVKILKCSFFANSTGDGVIFSEDDTADAVTLTRAAVEQNPIYAEKVFETGSGKVAYLMFNAFKRGIDDNDTANHTEYEEQLREVFRRFKSEGVSDLILDLRYNPGGYVSTCQLLSSMIAPTSKLGTRFLECRPNSSRSSTWYNLLSQSDVSDCNLDLDRLYVIATENSASASELVINNLRGVGMTVTHIGSTTEGKVVGMEVIDTKYNSKDKAEFGDYSYTLCPVSFRSYNALGQSDYENGLTPDIPYDEYMDDDSLDWLDWGTLGEEDEPLLARALAAIDGSRATAAGRSVRRSIETGAVDCRTLTPSGKGTFGSIVLPTDNATQE